MTLKNRLWQLKHSLPISLMNLWPHRSWTRIYLVDFGSTDGALTFIGDTCRAALDEGLLQVSTAHLPCFHASIAKNTAHREAYRAGTWDILVNLDCDNLLEYNSAPQIRNLFADPTVRALHYRGTDGCCGRIACYGEDFWRLGGYDENAHPFGAQDMDFIERLRMVHGSERARLVRGAFAIKNVKKATIAETDPCLRLRWGQMDQQNRTTFYNRRRSEGPYRRVPIGVDTKHWHWQFRSSDEVRYRA